MTDFEKFMNDEVTPDMPGDAFYSLEMTDAYKVGYWRDLGKTWVEQNQDKILSIRVFNEMREVRLSRFDIGQEFVIRVIDDAEKMEHYDECQILDKDGKESDGMDFVTTGGGKYKFPLPQLHVPAVLIRYYLKSKTAAGESGQTYVFDWRCVTFGEYQDLNKKCMGDRGEEA